MVLLQAGAPSDVEDDYGDTPLTIAQEKGLQEATFSESARKQLLGGTSGLLFVHLQEQEELQEAQERLRSLLVNSPQHPALTRPPPPQSCAVLC